MSTRHKISQLLTVHFWFGFEITRHVVQVVQLQVLHRILTGPAVICFPTVVCSRTLYTVCKLRKSDVINLSLLAEKYALGQWEFSQPIKISGRSC